MLSGLMPADGSDPVILRRRLLRARYSEVRMLFYLGKDVARWIEQCLEWSERIPALAELRLAPQSFAHFLARTTPAPVREKLLRWGVADFPSIFSRAIGIHALFSEPPPFEVCSEGFLESYHRFADALFLCFMDLQPWSPVPAGDFELELYASGEYTRKLESEWEHG
jgi:hypothetical protein